MNAPKYGYMPAHDALKSIGEPVIPVLVEKLKNTNDKKMQAKYALLLPEIAGKERGSALLRKAISELSEQENRLEESLRLIQ